MIGCTEFGKAGCGILSSIWFVRLAIDCLLSLPFESDYLIKSIA
jgi:hypothetical protein